MSEHRDAPKVHEPLKGTELRNYPPISGCGLRGRKTVTRSQA
jgi:hypothetical protein